MSERPIALSEAIIRGPRGRRFLLQFAYASALAAFEDHGEDSFIFGLFHAAYEHDPGRGFSRVIVGDTGLRPLISPSELARRLGAVPLAPVSDDLLARSLGEAADLARYWQEPDGEDVLMAMPELRPTLERVADHVCGADSTQWWSTPVATQSQMTVTFEGASAASSDANPAAVLREASEQVRAREIVARRDTPADVTAMCSGEWWSVPPHRLIRSSRVLSDGSPAGLWFVEDGMGWERASARRLEVAFDPRVYEIDSASSWARLCAEFPADVTAQKRHDWYRTTGREGDWVVPDWYRVAEQHDGVHLHVGAYLELAGTPITVDSSTASVIAGWDPDATFWFTPTITLSGDAEEWEFKRTSTTGTWIPVSSDPGGPADPRQANSG